MINNSYTEMLSVKSAIERTVQGYITVYSTVAQESNQVDQFFTAVERYVAALYVSGQIDNNYFVRTTNTGDLEISFVARTQHTRMTFLLPPTLMWKASNIEVKTPAPVAEIRPENLSLWENLFQRPAQQTETQPEAIDDNLQHGVGEISAAAIDYFREQLNLPPLHKEQSSDDTIAAYERAMKIVD